MNYGICIKITGGSTSTARTFQSAVQATVQSAITLQKMTLTEDRDDEICFLCLLTSYPRRPVYFIYPHNSVWKIMNTQLEGITKEVKVSRQCNNKSAPPTTYKHCHFLSFNTSVTWNYITQSFSIKWNLLGAISQQQPDEEGLILILQQSFNGCCAPASINTLAGINPIASIKCLLWPR